MGELNAKQELFCNEYIIDLNATQAAIRAGYSEKTAQEQSSRLLSNVMVSDRVRDLNIARQKRTQVDADYVLTRLKEINELDIIDILTDDMQAFRPISEWPKSWRISISGLDMQEIISGGDDPIEKVVKKIKWPDKTKNLELIGKHVNVQAFKERVDVSASEDLISLIQQGRARAAKND